MKHKQTAPGVTRVYSNTLREHVYFVSAAFHYELSGKLNGVVYTFNERMLLRGVTKEQLKVIHQAKKLFGGELVESDNFMDEETEE